MPSEHIAWAARDQLVARVEAVHAEDHSAIARRLSRRAHGVLASQKNECAIPWCNSVERDLFLLLEADPDVLSYDAMPKRVHVSVEGKPRTHVPSTRVRVRGGDMVLNSLDTRVGACAALADLLERAYRERRAFYRVVKRHAANWPTALLNQRVCPLLLLGELSAKKVFENTLYLEGQTLGEVVIGPYRWTDMAECDEFRRVLHLLDGRLGMAAPSGLGGIATYLRTHAYSRRLVGQAATLIDRARAVGLRRGRPCIGHDIFAEAVDERRIGVSRQKPNRFRVGDPSPGDGDARPANFEGSKRAGKGRAQSTAAPASSIQVEE